MKKKKWNNNNIGETFYLQGTKLGLKLKCSNDVTSWILPLKKCFHFKKEETEWKLYCNSVEWKILVS